MAGMNDNLIPPVKGEVRNPNGRPKGSLNIKTLAKKIANDMDTWDSLPANVEQIRKIVGKDKNVLEALFITWLGKASSDPRFANIIVELLDGKTKTDVNVLQMPTVIIEGAYANEPRFRTNNDVTEADEVATSGS